MRVIKKGAAGGARVQFQDGLSKSVEIREQAGKASEEEEGSSWRDVSGQQMKETGSLLRSRERVHSLGADRQVQEQRGLPLRTGTPTSHRQRGGE